MYIQIRTADGSKSKRVEVSRVTTVGSLKALIEDAFKLKQDNQRLFFGGKMLVDSHTMFDYNIKLNDVVMLMEQAEGGITKYAKSSSLKTISCSEVTGKTPKKLEVHPFFKVGDLVDAIWGHYGAWFEGCIVEHDGNSTQQNDSELLYAVRFNAFSDKPPMWIPVDSIRPRMQKRLSLSDIQVGDTVLVNYNILNPNERGYWYDLHVTHVSANNPTVLKGTLHVGRDALELTDCTIVYMKEVYQILKPVLSIEDCMANTHVTDGSEASSNKPVAKCVICMDDPKCKCKSCACCVCGGKHDEHLQIICDECDLAYHLGCLNPPLDGVPQVDYWYCSRCKNDASEIVQAGESLKKSRKKSKMPSFQDVQGKRDWGKGMACVGRSKQCTIVPNNHFGPIPGVEVGSSWKFRVSAAEAGVHRPQVAGIHGRESEGAFSLVLSGGYEDDIDNGEEFYYTGSGGRDLSGNKRTAKQSCDQTLTSMNLALAVNCNAPINKTDGGEAEDWKKGKPVRVLRNYKAAKHSKFAPKEGNRYDGIYKVVKYFPQKGESGFIVWRYLLRRDDPAPPPWSKEGQQKIKSLGLKMHYPDGYEEVMEAKNKDAVKGKSSKRSVESPEVEEPVCKRKKVMPYSLSEELLQKVQDDTLNQKLWANCKMKFDDGKSAFFDEIQKQFMCVICQDLVVNPITTVCCHNICERCLRCSFSASVFACPCCRYDLGKAYVMKVNEKLKTVLQTLFPGYESGR